MIIMKLYWLWVNNGNWGGDRSFYEIADSEEEAIRKCEAYKNYVDLGYDSFVREMQGIDILQHFHIKEGMNYAKYPIENEKYNFKYEITLKDD